MFISKATFLAYEEVRKSGLTNMLETKSVEHYSGGMVNTHQCSHIVRNYRMLYDLYINKDSGTLSNDDCIVLNTTKNTIECYQDLYNSENNNLITPEYTVDEIYDYLCQCHQAIKNPTRPIAEKDLCLTFATDASHQTWAVQTGDNSYAGPCYSYPHWVVVWISKDFNAKELQSLSQYVFDELSQYKA